MIVCNVEANTHGDKRIITQLWCSPKLYEYFFLVLFLSPLAYKLH